MDFYGFYTGKEFEAYRFWGHMPVRKEQFPDICTECTAYITDW